MRAEIIDPTTDTYGKFLERQDELHQYASFTSELSPDSRQTKLMSDLLLEQTQKVAELSKWKHPQLHKAVKASERQRRGTPCEACCRFRSGTSPWRLRARART